MDNLFYDLIYEKKTKRLLMILSLLSKTTSAIKTTELCEMCQGSQKNVGFGPLKM